MMKRDKVCVRNSCPSRLLALRHFGCRVLLSAAGVLLYCGLAAPADEGTGGPDFLYLPPGARSLALAGTYTALGDDAESIFYNPAGIIGLLNPQIFASHLAWWDGVSYDSLWGLQPLGDKGTLGGAISFLNVPSFDSTENAGALPVSAWDLAAGAAYAFKFDRCLALGGALKGLASQLGTARSWGLALDAGARYGLWNDQIVLGIGLQNIGFFQAFENTRDPLPLSAGFSVACYLWPDEIVRLSAGAELHVHWLGQPAITAGVESWFWELIAVRLGFQSAADTGDWMTMGAGVRWRKFHLDYAVMPLGLMGTVQHVSLGYDFGPQARLPKPKLSVRITTKQLIDAQGQVGYEVDFLPSLQIPAGLEKWEMIISNREGKALKALRGETEMPLIIPWDGKDDQGRAVDTEGYYRYRCRVLDRNGYAAEVEGEILPASITKLPQLKVLPRDIFAGNVTFLAKTTENIKEWAIEVVGADGSVLKKYQGLGAIPKDFAWDGTDMNNNPVSVKGVQFVVQFTDQAGNEVKSVTPLVQVEPGTKAYTESGLALAEQVVFHFRLPAEANYKSWALDLIESQNGQVVKSFHGEARPPENIVWDSKDEQGNLLPTNKTFGYVLRLQDKFGNVWQQAGDVNKTEVKVLSATPQEVRLRIEQILFDFAKAELKPSMFDKMQKAVDLVKNTPPEKVKILIEGHTDEIGTEEFNYELSLNRANMVMRYLVEEEGIPSALMEVKGLGKTMPTVTENNSVARSKNRRVEITISILP